MKNKEILIVLLALVTALIMGGCGTDSDKVINYIEKGNYEDAISLINEEIKGNVNKETDFVNETKSLMKNTLDDFNNEKLKSKQGEVVFATIEKIVESNEDDFEMLFEDFYDTYDEFNELKDSKKAFEKGKKAFDKGGWINAMENFVLVIDEDSNYKDAKNKIITSKKNFIEEEKKKAESFEKEKDYEKAYKSITNALKNLGESNEELENLLEDIAIKNADKNFKDKKDYGAAVKIITGAISAVGETKQLTEKLEYYKSFIPVEINDSDLFVTSNRVYVEDDCVDVKEKEYDYALVGSPSSFDSEFYANIYLNCKYTTLTATVIRPYESLSAKAYFSDGNVKIYGDDVMLYESPKITENTFDSYDINIDVSNVRNLKIVLSGKCGDGDGLSDPVVGLANVIVKKESQ